MARNSIKQFLDEQEINFNLESCRDSLLWCNEVVHSRRQGPILQPVCSRQVRCGEMFGEDATICEGIRQRGEHHECRGSPFRVPVFWLGTPTIAESSAAAAATGSQYLNHQTTGELWSGTIPSNASSEMLNCLQFASSQRIWDLATTGERCRLTFQRSILK